MSVRTTPDFESASLHESELNARQRDVLKLIAAGKTNAEIGESLGMTLDGAKWNVSEVLTKLGLASREEAAGYWHWRRSPSRRLQRSMRALFAATIGRAALGGAALAAGGVVAAGLLLQGGDAPDKVEPVPPFYLEAKISVRPGPDDRTGEQASTSRIKWFYQDERHFRQTINNESPSLNSTSLIMVADGQDGWFYDTATNSYSRTPLPPGGGAAASLLSLSAWMGPVPATDLDSFVALLKSYVKDGTVEVVGSDQMLGRPVRLIEMKSASGESVTLSTNGSETRSAGPVQTMRLWFDPATRMVLRYLAEPVGERQGIDLTVTRLEVGGQMIGKVFLFVPPPGAIERSDTTTHSSSGSGSSSMGSAGRTPPLPKPFVAVTLLPEGLFSAGQGNTEDNGGIVAAEDRWRSDSGATLTLQQRLRADGLPPGLQVGDRIQVSGHEAFRLVNGDKTTIAWYYDGLAVLITGNRMPEAELLRFAEGLKPSE
ncbi:MAG: hypothetical protein C0506_09910 [Anaerolinea sp.]|nr:hypothetical protein [Anaerolinea sp.]